MRMILNDGTEIPIVDGSYTGAVVLIAEDRQAAFDIWEQLTPPALHEVKISRDDGAVLHTLHGAVVDGIQIVSNPQGGFTVHIYMSETVTGDIATDAEYVQAAKILLGEEA